MPLLGALVRGLFVQLFGLLGFIFAKEVAVKLAFAAALLAITGVLYVAMRTAVVPLASSLFTTSYGSIIGLAFPPIAGACMLAISTVWVACGLYSYQRRAIAGIGT